VYGSDQDDDEQVVAAPGEPAPADVQQPVQEVAQETTDQHVPSADEALLANEITPVVSRVEFLTMAIEAYPDSPVNYVLRGEALADVGDYGLAAEDFQKALELADTQAEGANWGYIYQALADRAREGLRRVSR
jgi:tetratricopeptide (TPR) repeat protein